ncbi:helix-turn-helix transcriptional regulator [Streptomyces sp. HSW2009]|uniref:helix-turn-helix domain-containing protein n=1 Tax=Streptomyces sp. HSW2009 TaxID=3142890 RepID=UPI0032EE79B6
MAASRVTRGRTTTGTIAGFVLRLARESTDRTQVAIAEAMSVDLATWQGWETGRRPLANVKAGVLRHLRHRLLALGAAPEVLRLLDPAMDADRVIAATLQPTERDRHPLADWVHTRDTAHMIAWAVNGVPPPCLAHRRKPGRRGPVAVAPLLPALDRTTFFSRLRDIAECALRAGGDGMLLHRQALYLCSYDRSPEATSWMGHTLHTRRGLISVRGGTSQWATARSTATALARLGDRQPLLDFIANDLAGDDEAETANLNYWAYWLGSIREPQPDDGFMLHGPVNWEPVRLLHGLATGLHQAPTYLDLYAHSLWALLATKPWLPLADPGLTNDLSERVVQLLDHGEGPPRTRRELSSLHDLLREKRT